MTKMALDEGGGFGEKFFEPAKAIAQLGSIYSNVSFG
jgi:hypothetical protein